MQVTQDYQPGVLHRPDLALAIYGFVLKTDPPVLAAQVCGRRREHLRGQAVGCTPPPPSHPVGVAGHGHL